MNSGQADVRYGTQEQRMRRLRESTNLSDEMVTTPKTLSDFIRNATPEEKEEVYLDVIRNVEEQQLAALMAYAADKPTGAF